MRGFDLSNLLIELALLGGAIWILALALGPYAGAGVLVGYGIVGLWRQR